jgi:flagellar hook assembly protein FlgD
MLQGMALASRGRAVPTVAIGADRAAIQPRAVPVRFTVTSSEDSAVTVVVAPAGGGPDVATLSNGDPISAGGSIALTWNGTDDDGVKVPDGRYVAIASALGADGTGTANASVWVDGVAPRITWRSASPEPLTDMGSMRLAFELRNTGLPDEPVAIKLRVADA